MSFEAKATAEARYTDPDQAATFVEETGIDALATKFNVNTELREAYLATIKENLSSDLLDLMRTASTNMEAIVESKLRLFGSTGMFQANSE